MRREELYLSDMVEALDAIQQFLTGVQREEFLQNDLTRSAILQKLTIIGEAAARLPKGFQDRHPEIEWADIVGFRNIAVHSYFSVDWSIVWITATQDAPELRRLIADILAKEYPGTG
ncbi:MAG TPA: DUF86 domain-containing protein [Roseiflexaceae bacterium]